MNSRIRILHIIKSLGRGGAEMLLPTSLQLHDKSKFDFHYAYFLPWKNQMVESIAENGGKVICFKANNNFQLMAKAWAVARYIREHNIQMIHAHLPWAGILARVVSKMTGVPVVYTEHNKQERYHFGTRMINLLTMNWLAEIVAVSNDVAVSIHKHKPSIKIPIRTILNGVNTEHYNPLYFENHELKRELGIPFDAPVIGTIAVFRFQKRLDVWIDIAFEILKKFTNAHFIIVGDGPLKQSLLEKREKLGLNNRLHMPGLKTEVRPYLSIFDVYMMSSIFEGLPIAMLEAMAMGCPVITTNAGGIKEVIRHKVDGLLCSVDQPNDLIDMGCGLLADEDLRKQLKLNARRRVLESFNMNNMVKELENVYYQYAKK